MPATLADAEQLLPLSQFLRRLPASRGGRRTAPSTLTRYVLRGVNTPAGRVRLRAVRIGCRWLTCESAWNEFVERQTAAYLGADDTAPTRTPAERRRASEAAESALIEMGC